MKASVVLLICVPLIPLSIVAVQKIAGKLFRKYWGYYSNLGTFLENLQGLTTLKIYQADEEKAVQMDDAAQKFRKITMKVLTMQLNSTSVMDIVAYGGAAVGMAVAAGEYFAGNITLSGTMMIVLLASEFFIPLRLLGSFFHISMNGMSASDKIFRFLDTEEPEKGNLDFSENEKIRKKIIYLFHSIMLTFLMRKTGRFCMELIFLFQPVLLSRLLGIRLRKEYDCRNHIGKEPRL